MGQLTEAGVDGSDELFHRADDIECAAWSALISRVRVPAGESP
jgi:hypothetical protein